MFLSLLISLVLSPIVQGQIGTNRQAYDYVTVREGAHMFYWLYYTTATDENSYTERPLVVWLQGGPGGSSTGIGNFDIMGPLDLSLRPRNYTWVNHFNVLYVDNPVGAGFSYVDNETLYTTNNEEIANDFFNLMRGFYTNHPEFEGVPLYIYGQSYGGKMAVDMAIRLKEEEAAGTINSNLRGIAMGNAWISPTDATLTWGPLLLAAGLVDQEGHDWIQANATRAETLFNEGNYYESFMQWSMTQRSVFRHTNYVDFYDILNKVPPISLNRLNKSPLELSADMLVHNKPYMWTKDNGDDLELTLYDLMNNIVKPALRIIPDHVVWDANGNTVFYNHGEDFMKPVTQGIEKLLNETDIIIQKYNGNLDLICSTPGQLIWLEKLKWPGAEGFKNATREPIWENGRLQGYVQRYDRFRFFWINVAGHSVPRDNPDGSKAFLRDMTNLEIP